MKKINKIIATITYTLCLSTLFSLPSVTSNTTNDNPPSYNDIFLYNDEIIDAKN